MPISTLLCFGSRGRCSAAAASGVSVLASAPVSTSSNAGMPFSRTGASMKLRDICSSNSARRVIVQPCTSGPGVGGSAAQAARPIRKSRERARSMRGAVDTASRGEKPALLFMARGHTTQT